MAEEEILKEENGLQLKRIHQRDEYQRVVREVFIITHNGRRLGNTYAQREDAEEMFARISADMT